MVEPFKVHNLIVVTLLAVIGFMILKFALKAVGQADLAQAF